MNARVLYLRRAASSGLLNSATSAVCVALVLPGIIAGIGFESYGYWAILGAFVGVASLLDLGMSKALVFLISSDETAESELVCVAVAVCMGVTALVSAGVIVLVWSGVPLFGGAVARQPGLAPWIAGAGVAVLCCQVLTTLARAVFEARCKAHVVNIGFAAFTLTYYLLAMGLALYGVDVRILIAASAGVFLLSLVAHLQLLWTDRPLAWRQPTRAMLRKVARVALGTFSVDLPSVAYLPLLLWSFLVLAPAGSDYGAFDLATRIAILCSTALGTLAVPFYALVAGARDGDRREVRSLLDRFVPWMLMLAAAGWFVFALVGEQVLRWWIPEAPPALAAALRILLAGSLLHAAFEPVTRLLLGAGERRQLMKLRIAMLTACYAALLLLQSLPMLQRFSIAAAVGWVVAAALLVLALRSVKWGRPVA